jgi:hypothetical protein
LHLDTLAAVRAPRRPANRALPMRAFAHGVSDRARHRARCRSLPRNRASPMRAFVITLATLRAVRACLGLAAR